MKLSQFAQISLRLVKFTQMIWFYPNLKKILIIQPDISKRTKITMEYFYIDHLWTRLFEVTHNWMKLLQIGKTWFDWWTSPKYFQFI